jgi:vacuolar-type H+-ATPase subunit H
MVETTIEKKLHDDILEKNTLRNEIEGYVRTVSKWRDKLADLKSFQGQTKYADSIKRYVTKIEGLRVELNQLNEEVEKNIRETGKFADADVKAFSSQLEQDVSKYIGETEKKAPEKKIKIKPNPAQAKKKIKAKLKGIGKGVGSLE